jgi:histidinol phosphatase-like enzyme (inositol monophosphatase family)
MPLTEQLQFMQQLADESAKIIVPFFRSSALATELKQDRTLVTAADRNTEEHLRELIHRKYPAHGVIGEEFGSERPDAEFVWIIDPIDGTIAFVAGCPLFGTLIGLLHQGRPVLGSINQPILKQYCSGDCEQAWLNGQRCRARELTDLGEATLLTTDTREPRKHRRESGFLKLVDTVKVYRSWGDCYGYLLLATGFADIMIDPIMKPWDLLPVIPVIQGAGAVITGWDGSDPAQADSAVAASRTLHPRVLTLLTE